MIPLSPEAAEQVARLVVHFEAKGRVRATENLIGALERARQRILSSPRTGLAAPRPYPGLRQQGRLWLIEGSYWIAYRPAPRPIIIGVFYATANIPHRV